jgi:hypothetical protein
MAPARQSLPLMEGFAFGDYFDATGQEPIGVSSLPGVCAPLWEVARMRSILLYADQLQRMLTTLPGPQGAILETLPDKLKDEPCVKEFLRLPPCA